MLACTAQRARQRIIGLKQEVFADVARDNAAAEEFAEYAGYEKTAARSAGKGETGRGDMENLRSIATSEAAARRTEVERAFAQAQLPPAHAKIDLSAGIDDRRFRLVSYIKYSSGLLGGKASKQK